MGPEVQQFIYVNGLVILALVLYFLFRRSKGSPSRLKLRERFRRDKPEVRPVVDFAVDFKSAPEHEMRTERTLNVIFQFNGHDFDAYEVLGLTAGSSFELVESTYKQLQRTSTEDTREFLQIAFDAIKLKLTRL